MARGRYVVVFDAEDVPDRDQLRKAATRFENDPKLQCLQAELVIDNGDENWLTAMFSGEYAGLFSVLLPALARWGMPMPLGGTSNHFPVQTLRELGGWDSFNVTEDADLGMRLARRRMKTAMLASKTREEAPTHVGVWVKQRTRWMKGWMQTFIVHNRNPVQTVRDMGWKAFVVFEVLVGGMILAPLLHSAFLVVVIARVALGDNLNWQSFTSWTALYFVIFILGYVAAWAMVLTGLHRVGHKTTWLAQAGFQIYWLLQSVATVRALNELIEKPFYWAKTEHRIRRQKSKLARESLLILAGRWVVRLGGTVMRRRGGDEVVLRRGEMPVIEAMVTRLG